MNPIISIVIVNFNSGNLLRKCLTSLFSQTIKDWEIIIIDNESNDDSLSNICYIEKLFVIKNPINRGFAAGQNQGISYSSGKYILALNFDIILPDHFLENLLIGMEENLEAGWACGKLLNMTDSVGLSSTLYSTGHVLPLNRFPKLRGNGENDTSQFNKSEYVFGAPGAAALYRRSMIEDLTFDNQFFDESFFTWYEDVDIDWRAQNRGWKCLYVPDAVAYHMGHVGEEYQEPFRSFRARLTIRNRWLMIIANETRLFSILKPLIKYEFSLLIYVVRDHLITAYLKALVDFIKLTPIAIAKRKQTFKPKVYGNHTGRCNNHP
jgi:GT2 family glycosyltransferase